MPHQMSCHRSHHSHHMSTITYHRRHYLKMGNVFCSARSLKISSSRIFYGFLCKNLPSLKLLPTYFWYLYRWSYQQGKRLVGLLYTSLYVPHYQPPLVSAASMITTVKTIMYQQISSGYQLLRSQWTHGQPPVLYSPLLHDWWSTELPKLTISFNYNYQLLEMLQQLPLWIATSKPFQACFLCRSHNIGEYCQMFSLYPTTPGSISLTGHLGAVVTWSHTTSIVPIPNSYLTVRLLRVWWTKERNNFFEYWK